jgi:hypothetical protein
VKLASNLATDMRSYFDKVLEPLDSDADGKNDK